MSTVLKYKKIDFNLDITNLKDEVTNLCSSPNWVEHVNRNCFAGGWNVLPLRCQAEYSEKHPILQCFSHETKCEWNNLPELTNSQSLMNVYCFFNCNVKSMRLMNLKAHSSILPHTDKGLSLEQGEIRLHIPISGSEGVSFFVDNERVPMMKNELWYINANLTHSVQNNSDFERINLVIDCEVNDWLFELVTV